MNGKVSPSKANYDAYGPEALAMPRALDRKPVTIN